MRLGILQREPSNKQKKLISFCRLGNWSGRTSSQFEIGRYVVILTKNNGGGFIESLTPLILNALMNQSSKYFGDRSKTYVVGNYPSLGAMRWPRLWHDAVVRSRNQRFGYNT